MTTPTDRQDTSRGLPVLSWILTPVEGLARVMNVVGTLMVLGLVVVVNGDVIARNLFNAPFLGAVELVQFSLVLIVFMQLPDVIRVDRLTRSDGFLMVLGGMAPRLGSLLSRLIDLFAALFMGLIAWTIYPDFIETLHSGRYFGVPGVFTMPVWPQNLAITVASVMCVLMFVAKALRGPAPHLRGARPAAPGDEAA